MSKPTSAVVRITAPPASRLTDDLPEAGRAARPIASPLSYVPYLLIGALFGVVMLKSGAASWFRIYEMFTFRSFHMYGIIGSALACGLVFTQVVKRTGVRGFGESPITFRDKDKTWTRYAAGGTVFGLGWAIAGACPGPMFTLVGAGLWPILVVLASSVLGTYLYGRLRSRLPH